MPVRGVEDILITPDSTFSYDDNSGFDWNASYVAPNRPYSPLRVIQTQNYDPGRFTPPPQIFPTVRIIDPDAEGEDDPQDSGTDTAPIQVAVPTIIKPPTTVPAAIPEGIYETNRAPTDWDAVYDEYVILNEPTLPEVAEVAIDWGGVFAEAAGTIVGGFLDPFGAGEATTAFFQPNTLVAGPALNAPVATSITPTGGGTMAAGCPPTGPKYGKICLATGVVTPLRRRRRRRLLTSSDIKDLSALKSIVGGAALQAAVTQAVRR